VGPVLYILGTLKTFLGPTSNAMLWDNDYAILMPTIMIYFSLIGFHLGRVAYEKGTLRLIFVLGVLGFLGYIHYLAWGNLSDYYLPHAYQIG